MDGDSPSAHAAQAAVPHRLDAQNPWPGLASFGEDDRDYFRGRDQEADELARLVRRERLTVLFGRSGLGKTSLLGAGLFPRLRQDMHLPVLLRIGYDSDTSPRNQVWAALRAACERWGVEAAAPRPDESLWAYFHRADAGFWNVRNRPVLVVLVFDQFEEVFTVGHVDENSRRTASEFVDELAGLIEDRPPEALRHALDVNPTLAEGIDFSRRGCKVLLSFREDFLAEVEGLRERLPSVMRNRYRLQPMNAPQARAVIASGAALVDDGVAERILGLAWCNRAEAPTAEEAERLEIDPALLSVICSELNLRRQTAGAPRIGADLLAGAEREILVDFYERALRGLDPRVRVFIEDELITSAGFRDSHAFDDALRLPGVSREAIDHLVASRLLRVDDRFGVRRLELTHDVLTRVVKDSRDARQARDMEFAVLERARAATAVQRRNRRVSALIGVAAVAAFALLGWSWILFNEADQATAKADNAAESARISALASVRMASAAAEATDAAEAARKVATETETRAIGAEAKASEAQAQSVAARNNAVAAQRDALATNLVVHARAARPEEFDRAVLLAAEAIRQFPERQDIQIEQFGRLLAAPKVQVRLPLPQAARFRTASADGAHFALATDDGGVHVVSAISWQPLHRITVRRDGPVEAMALDRTGQRLLTAADGQVVAWQLKSGTAIARLQTRTDSVRVALSADGRWAAVAGLGGIQLWALPDVPTTTEAAAAAQTVEASAERLRVDGLRCLAFSQDSSRLVLVGNKSVSAWTVAERRLETPLRSEGILGHSADCTRVVEILGTQQKPLGFELRDALSGASLGRVERPQRSTSSARFELSGDGRTLIQAGEYRVAVWQFEPPALPVEASPVRLPRGELKVASVSADGRWLALASGRDGKAVVVLRRDGDGGEFREVVSWFMPYPIEGFVFAPNGDSLLLLPAPFSRGEKNQHLPVAWDLRGGARLHLGNQLYRADEIEFNRAGTVLGSAAADGGGAHFWNTVDGRFLREIKDFSIAEFSPDGSRLAIFSRRNAKVVELLPMEGGVKPLASISVAEGVDVEKLAISKDNQKVAMVRDDGSVWLHGTGPGTAARRMSAKPSRATAVAFNPDSRTLAWGGEDGKVRLVPIDRDATPKVLAEGHKQEITKLAFSSDGQYLASGGADGSAIVHVPGEARTVARFDGHRGSVTALVFIEGNGGLALVAGRAKGERKVWDVARRLWLADLGGSESDIRSVELSPDPEQKHRRAAVLRRDGTVSLHDWDRDSLLAETCKLANRNLECVEWEQYFPGQPYHATCREAPAPICRTPTNASSLQEVPQLQR